MYTQEKNFSCVTIALLITLRIGRRFLRSCNDDLKLFNLYRTWFALSEFFAEDFRRLRAHDLIGSLLTG